MYAHSAVEPACRRAARPGARLVASLIALLLAAASPLHAARTAVAQYTTRDGLPQAQVTALLQDRAGYLWVGTLAGGIGRYNGMRWDVFDATSGLPGGGVNALALDEAGRVVAATSGGAARFENGRWTPIPVPAQPLPSSVNAVLPVRGSQVWLGTPVGLARWSGSGPPTFPFLGAGGAAEKLATAAVLAVAPGGAREAWVGTARGLGHLVLEEPPRLEPVAGLGEDRVVAVLARPGRPLLVALAGKGLFQREGEGWTRIGDDRVPGVRVYGLAAEAEDPDSVWIGTDNDGAFLWRKGTIERFGPSEGLLDPHVYAVLEDREGVLWFGTDAGLTKRRPSAFLSYGEADGLPAGGAIFGMVESHDRALWLAAWDHGLFRMERDGLARRVPTEGLADPRVLDVALGPDGVVWASTRNGLAQVQNGRLAPARLPAGLPRAIWSIRFDPEGHLIVGGRDGLYAVRGGRVERLLTLEGRDVATVALHPDGTTWAGGEGWGAAALRGTQVVERLTQASGLPSNQVNMIFVDSRGTLWMATDRGAWSREAGGRTRLLDRASGLPDSYVYWIGEDREGALWFGTNRGAARLLAGRPLEVFTSRDGLGTDECNEDGFLVDSRGSVYVATVGVSRYLGPPRPHHPVDPPAQIEEFLVDGQPLNPAARAELPPDPGPLVLRFAGLSFMDERGVRFRYRLLGLSDAWTDTMPGQTETTYGALGPGQYVFEVGAETADGRRSGKPATVSFRIRPHWWRTPTARLAVATLLVAAVLLVMRLRERGLTQARARLEREVALRTEELRRANDRLAALAVTDDLTGLVNRRKVLEELANAIALARRQGTPLSVALGDLDHFKGVNDTLGHGEGDRLLVIVAGAMKGALREIDLLARYGGEEFLALLPGSDAPGAREACERLRRAVEQIPFTNPATGRPPTISIGIATLDPQTADASALIHQADEALYAAKQAGRNQVVVYDGPASSGALSSPARS